MAAVVVRELVKARPWLLALPAARRGKRPVQNMSLLLYSGRKRKAPEWKKQAIEPAVIRDPPFPSPSQRMQSIVSD
jgi:hypothetical protein